MEKKEGAFRTEADGAGGNGTIIITILYLLTQILAIDIS